MTERAASRQVSDVVEERPPASGPAVRAPAAAEFRALFERESSYVCNSLRRLGVRESDVPDLAHEVFLALYRRLQDGGFDTERPLGPWLMATAFRIASGHRRLARHRREVFVDQPPPVASSAPAVDELLAAAEDRALLLAALDRIPLERRVVLVMHDIDEHTMPQIAEALEVGLNTAYSRLRLARQDLRRAIHLLAPEKLGAATGVRGSDDDGPVAAAAAGRAPRAGSRIP